MYDLFFFFYFFFLLLLFFFQVARLESQVKRYKSQAEAAVRRMTCAGGHGYASYFFPGLQRRYNMLKNTLSPARG